MFSIKKDLFTIKRLRETAAVFGKGLAMGAADAVPGISGGTIALITGIYLRFIQAIESFGIAHVKALGELFFLFPLASRRKKAWGKIQELDIGFIVPLLSGIGLGLAVMIQIIPFLLEHYAYFTYAFFSGLIFSSLPIPLRQMQRKWKEAALLFLSAGALFFLTGLQESGEGDSRPLAVLLSGALAICVMVLPGVSGSYVLVLLGQYKLIAQAARDGDLFILFFFGLGVIIGILIFVRVLRYFLNRFLSPAMAVLTGMMIGSLNGIWPLRHAAKEMSQIEIWAGGVGTALAGSLLVFLLGYFSSKKR